MLPHSSIDETVTVRGAERGDMPDVVALLRLQADYHSMSDEFELTAATFEAAVFADHPVIHCNVAQVSEQIVGVVTWMYTYSTFQGKHGIHIEDLFVDRGHRSGRVLYSLMRHLARQASNEDLGRIEWVIQEWNAPAQASAVALGATISDGWVPWRWQGPEMLGHAAETSNFSMFRKQLRSGLVESRHRSARVSEGAIDDAVGENPQHLRI